MTTAVLSTPSAKHSRSTKAPRALADLLPGAPTDLAFYRAPHYPLSRDDPHEFLTEAERRQQSLLLGALVVEMGELVDALRAVYDADDRTDRQWSADIYPMFYFAQTFQSLLEGQLFGPLCNCAEAERERRRQAFADGAHCGCPVLWLQRTLDSAEAALKRHGPKLLGDERCDARVIVWTVTLFKDLAFGSGSVAHHHMNAAAKQADLDEMLAGPLAQKTLMKMGREKAAREAGAAK